MKLSILILVFLSTVNCVLIEIPNLGKILGSAILSQWTNKTIYQFLNIKFALPPSGHRRFMPPEPVSAWSDTYNATTQGRECPQKYTLSSSKASQDDIEDCLSLNVFTTSIPGKDVSNNDLLPVMVYIHGGGFYESSSVRFPPNYILENDVVLVVIQYRLGPFGFLSLHTDGIAGNVGMMDQVMALEWVNKHIIAFGGDNSRVTIFGQSAGAASVSLHLVSPMVKPYLFQKAILQSGSSFAQWVLHEDPVGMATRIFQVLKNTTEEHPVEEMEETLRNASATELLRATFKAKSPKNSQDLGVPIVQKAGKVKYLVETPMESLQAGRYRAVPLMAGVTKHDGSFITQVFYDLLESMNIQNNDEYLRTRLMDNLLRTASIPTDDPSDASVHLLTNIYFKEVYDQNKNLTFKDVTPGIVDVLGSYFLKASTLKQGKINSNYVNHTYLYSFDYLGQYTRYGYGGNTTKYPFKGGVHHSDDLLYLFPYFYETPLNKNDTKIAQLMTDLWTSFAKNAQPTSSLLDVPWPAMEKNKNGPYLHICNKPSVGDDFVDQEYVIATKEKGKNLIDASPAAIAV